MFGLATPYRDDVMSANAPELVEPAPVACPHAGWRLIFTIKVKDANAVCAELTAAFADPAGNVWEIAQEL